MINNDIFFDRLQRSTQYARWMDNVVYNYAIRYIRDEGNEEEQIDRDLFALCDEHELNERGVFGKVFDTIQELRRRI